ncbi:uncharacterized protein LOC125493340 isoform X2 [Beta vulgaris subsp. vulgaris]|uniref:uncharacterized protein LOC125493340 isoform X2 n=1 Tax=Beta vulgaris subsp. vulgaris TaxID=3555 RepID=UPI0025482CA7|nr:uncharacterized protein LOC125493340 isoform X2 [Beta vulgaris subsp. vulgaris]
MRKSGGRSSDREYVSEAECLEQEGGRKYKSKKKRKSLRDDGVGKQGGKRKKVVDKKLVLSPEIFRGIEKSVGGEVKSRSEVLKTQLAKCKGAQANVNCRVETLGKIIGGFCEMKRQWVRDMGFEGLLYLRGKRLPRNFCYWLMTLVDTCRNVIMFPGGIEYPMDKRQVHWVLGIPHGPKRVPLVARNENVKRAVLEIQQKYGSSVGIPMVKVIEKVEGISHSEDEVEFKTAFLMLALCDFLCPTTCRRLESDLVVASTLAVDAHKYDWASLVLDKLLVHARHFAEKFYREGYAKGCGGCTYFLAIMYLDRLHRPPVRWGLFPRLKAWSAKDVTEAKEADRQSGKGDYGNIGCIDLAYGEKHPLVARDTMGPQCMSYEIAALVLSGMGLEINPLHRNRNAFDDNLDSDSDHRPKS